MGVEYLDRFLWFSIGIYPLYCLCKRMSETISDHSYVHKYNDTVCLKLFYSITEVNINKKDFLNQGSPRDMIG